MIPTDRSFWLLDWFRWSVSLSLEVKIRLRETLNRRTDLLGCLVTVCCCWTCFWWLKCLRSTHIGHQTPSPKLPKQVEGHQLILKDSFWNFENHPQRKGIFDYFQEVFYMPIILLMIFERGDKTLFSKLPVAFNTITSPHQMVQPRWQNGRTLFERWRINFGLWSWWSNVHRLGERREKLLCVWYWTSWKCLGIEGNRLVLWVQIWSSQIMLYICVYKYIFVYLQPMKLFLVWCFGVLCNPARPLR